MTADECAGRCARELDMCDQPTLGYGGQKQEFGACHLL